MVRGLDGCRGGGNGTAHVSLGAQAPDPLETLGVRRKGAVLNARILAPPMNLLGPELVRDLVTLIQWAEADDTVSVVVFTSGDPDYFISHVDLNRIADRAEAAKLVGEPSLALLYRLRPR